MNRVAEMIAATIAVQRGTDGEPLSRFELARLAVEAGMKLALDVPHLPPAPTETEPK